MSISHARPRSARKPIARKPATVAANDNGAPGQRPARRTFTLEQHLVRRCVRFLDGILDETVTSINHSQVVNLRGRLNQAIRADGAREARSMEELQRTIAECKSWEQQDRRARREVA